MLHYVVEISLHLLQHDPKINILAFTLSYLNWYIDRVQS